jgi:hypothetical protein
MRNSDNYLCASKKGASAVVRSPLTPSNILLYCTLMPILSAGYAISE